MKDVIKDTELKKAINEALGRGWTNKSISSKDVGLLTELELDNRSIDSIEGLEYAINLKKLDLSDNDIEDISPLKQLKKLEHLNLKENKISDISAIRDLKKLKSLNLEYNNVEDISALENLKKLKYLNLTDCSTRINAVGSKTEVLKPI